jgi:hypothetical protein
VAQCQRFMLHHMLQKRYSVGQPTERRLSAFTLFGRVIVLVLPSDR